MGAAFPELGERVTSLVAAHDGLCGTVARMTHVVGSTQDGPGTQIVAIFTRFEAAYAEHAQREGELFEELGPKLRAKQREQLSDLVRGL